MIPSHQADWKPNLTLIRVVMRIHIRGWCFECGQRSALSRMVVPVRCGWVRLLKSECSARYPSSRSFRRIQTLIVRSNFSHSR